MNKYLIYTIDGYTEDLDGNNSNNCQILGRAEGRDKDDAINNFLVNQFDANSQCFESFEAVQLHDSEIV